MSLLEWYIIGAFIWFGIVMFRAGMKFRTIDVTPFGLAWNFVLWPLAIWAIITFRLGRLV